MRFSLQNSLSKILIQSQKDCEIPVLFSGAGSDFLTMCHIPSLIYLVPPPPSQLGFLRIAVIGLELLASEILLLQSPKELGFQAGTTLRPREINQLAEDHELLAGRSKWRSVSHRS